MVLGNETLLGGLVAALSLFAINFAFKKLQWKFPKFSRVLQGESIMLIYHGKILPSHLRLAEISEDELMQAIREHGVSSVAEVDLAVLEVDGNISVLSDNYSTRSQKRRKSHRVMKQQIS